MGTSKGNKITSYHSLVAGFANDGERMNDYLTDGPYADLHEDVNQLIRMVWELDHISKQCKENASRVNSLCDTIIRRAKSVEENYSAFLSLVKLAQENNKK